MSMAFLPLRRLALVGDPGASRASHLPRLRPRVVIPSRPGRPFRHSCGRWWKCDPARPWRHIPPRLALVVVIRRVQGVPPSASAAAGGDPVTSRASPSSTAGAGGRKGGGVPVYGGIVYCQHAILECGFIDFNCQQM